MSLAELADRVASYQKNADRDLIERAYDFSRRAHEGQRRLSGEPYIEHPLAVAAILAELELDDVTIAAALLHDVVEDTGTPVEEVAAAFGEEVAELVDGVTKLERLNFRSTAEAQAENVRKMFLAMAKDIRVILIKLADRLHNMRTLGALAPDKQRRIAEETLDIYAPLAARLGIFRIKWELEDLALRYLEPEAYRDLAERIPRKRAEREAFAQVIIEALKARLGEAGIRADVSGRAKHFYSIYNKMRKGRDLAEIYDLVAIRVIVDEIRDCYGVLGIVHAMWKPLPGRFKDYIATPKQNMYQSLHTTVIGPMGEPFEIQIRTWDMHRTAEYGIAAHWRYKEGRTDPDFDKKLAWLREVLEWQRETKDAHEFMESLKIDLFSDEVFVFTPRGDVIGLPNGACPIDFAYRIHTEVGNRCVGARVNGRMVPLGYVLKTGDIVEILTRREAQPSLDWLSLVKTSTAKNRIRQWFKRARREENLERGREMVERELARLGLTPADAMKEAHLEEVRRRLNLASVEDLFVNVGYGGVSAQHVANRLRELARRAGERERLGAELEALMGKSGQPARAGDRRGEWGKPSGGVRVRGIDNVLVRFPRCCSPVPGDSIVGYVTQGRGVSIHHADCPNVTQHLRDPARLIEVSWDEVHATQYPVELTVYGADRPGLLSDVAQAISESRVNIVAATARSRDDRTAFIDLVVSVRDLEQLDVIQRRIRRIPDVISVERPVKRMAR
ncbi:MAG: bifunctional (p)ppGpp synthetase/guanosine-3',5'-bis(diphosphate) 3'-pyrophosphohydrolase [Clostridia bacterium]|nr:bifunctional (p)ppGpp synthetase/guanosine-3',5'-bis(diphosphate) 3'-pyrophosphohydrolase [Clostridia bacterium]